VPIVELLLHSGANVNAQTSTGDTALHLAAQKNHAAVVTCLLSERAHSTARTDLRNRDGKLAEYLAKSDAVRDAFAKPSANLIHMMPQEEDDESDESDDE
jgi:ankyrin repeat protein